MSQRLQRSFNVFRLQKPIVISKTFKNTSSRQGHNLSYEVCWAPRKNKLNYYLAMISHDKTWILKMNCPGVKLKWDKVRLRQFVRLQLNITCATCCSKGIHAKNSCQWLTIENKSRIFRKLRNVLIQLPSSSSSSSSTKTFCCLASNRSCITKRLRHVSVMAWSFCHQLLSAHPF